MLRFQSVCDFGCLKEGFTVSSGSVQWYRSSSGTTFDNSEMASPVSELKDASNSNAYHIECFA